MDISFAHKLLTMPLFQGLSHSDLGKIIGHTKFGFEKYGAGAAIAKEGMPCKELIFVVSGRVEAITNSADRSYSLAEKLSPPLQLQPERLFGMRMRYTSTFKAVDQCNTISLSKAEVQKLTSDYEVFRINFLNTITARQQKMADAIWESSGSSKHQRIARFILCRCSAPTGEN